jgi:hypothetical protein
MTSAMSDDAYGFAMRHGTCSVTWLRDLDGLDWPLDRFGRDIEEVRRDIALVERMTTATTSREYAATPEPARSMRYPRRTIDVRGGDPLLGAPESDVGERVIRRSEQHATGERHKVAPGSPKSISNLRGEDREHGCSSACHRECDLDSESAGRPTIGGDEGVVHIGDSLDDREPKPESIGRACFLVGELLERLEQSRQLIGWNWWSGVLDCEPRLRYGSAGGDLDPAVGGVVPDRVPQQIVDEALDQSRIADRRSLFKLRSHRQPSRLAGSKQSGGDRSEVDPLAPSKRSLTAGKSKTRVEQSLLLLAGVENFCADRLPSGCVRVGINQGKLEERSLCCQRRAELVRDVGGKAGAVARCRRSVAEAGNRSRVHRSRTSGKVRRPTTAD